jgi:acetyl esterase/lipase
MRIGMILHGYPFPRPPKPTFTRTLSDRPYGGGSVDLLFYTPKGYPNGPAQGNSTPGPHRYPIVVNFHGGGFCLGAASDDARWARILVETTDAVVVSVDYRLAPEFPFPAAVDDGVDALLYLEEHADELSLDISRVALTGFSAGGNLSFTVPLRLHSRTLLSRSSSVSSIGGKATGAAVEAIPLQPQGCSRPFSSSALRLCCIVSWYPILDFVVPRHIRRDRSVIPAKTLPPALTSLFDDSYLPDHADRASPYASPLRADDGMLAAALPADVFINMCEWDMLEHEGKEFVQRLEACGEFRGENGKVQKRRVRSMVIEQSQHAWDKSVNPFRDQGRVDVLYQAASQQMRTIFDHQH